MTSTQTALTVLGALLVLGALVSGIARRSVLSLTALFVLFGVVLGQGGFGVLEFSPTSGFVSVLATVALVVILFRDGLEVEGEMLLREWHVPLRALLLAMPITAAIVAVGVAALTDLSWTQAFLVGALLSPTDPVLSSGVVTNPRVPRLIRHTLNLESGLNDGLALPPVLALVAVLQVGDNDFVWWRFVLQDVSLGLAFGVAIGFLASLLLPRGGRLTASIPAHQKALYALGVAFLTYGITTLPPHGNGFIAVYVCAITLGIRRPDIRGHVEARTDDIVEIVKLGIFVVFGSLLTVEGLFLDGWAAVGIVVVTLLIARPVALTIALIGTGVSRTALAFMAWFGPKGVATMTFSLLVLGSGVPGAERMFDIAALVVLCSIVAHGLTDTTGAEWMARQASKEERESLKSSGSAKGAMVRPSTSANP
jgi:NhaP-type Na+/H+ or K+/H+ antiporter